MAMSAARMVEDGVIKVGGAELGRAILMLLPSADSGNLRFRRFSRGSMGSDMVVQKRVSMLYGVNLQNG
jgi:hypothetical protein